MFIDDPPISAGQLPATFQARFSWFVWVSMALALLLGLFLLRAAAWGLSAGWAATDSGFFIDFIALVCVGFAMLAMPLIWLWSVYRGLPRLHVDHGVVRLTTLYGRARVLHLSDYAEVSLHEAGVGRGYQPRLEAVPNTPGQKIEVLALGQFAHNRAEAEALVALVRQAAGNRPALSPAQSAQQKQLHRKEWKSLAIIVGGSVALLILLSWPR